MKTLLITFIFTLTSLVNIYAQVDTLYTLNQKIPGTITELGQTELKYTKPSNSIMQILLPLSYLHKIVFANGEVMMLDSSLQLNNTPKDSSFTPLLTHYKQETEGLKLVAQDSAIINGAYYYNFNYRPNSKYLKNVVNMAKLYNAQIAYIESDDISSNIVSAEGNTYVNPVHVKFYAHDFQNYSYIQSMLTTNKKYNCKRVRSINTNYFVEDNIQYTPIKVLDTTDTKFILNSVIVQNNRCFLLGEIGGFQLTPENPIQVIYFDSNKLIAVYFVKVLEPRIMLLNFFEMEPKTKK